MSKVQKKQNQIVDSTRQLKEKEQKAIPKQIKPNTLLRRGVIALVLMLLATLALWRLPYLFRDQENGLFKSTATLQESSVQIFPFDVIDVEYSLSLDRLIIVSHRPPQLHIYDPETGADETITLSRTPTSVSVSPDGLFAAVGHDDGISYLNLLDQQLVQFIATTFPVADLVLADTSWVYTVPASQSPDPPVAYSLLTGDELVPDQQPWSINLVARLHPDGQSLFLTGWPYVSLEKRGIGGQGFTSFARWSTDKSCDDIWFSQDGLYLFTACGLVFHTPNESNLEVMVYDSLPYQNELARHSRGLLLQHVQHIGSAQLILAIQGQYAERTPGTRDGFIIGTNTLLFFEYPSLRFIAEEILPSFSGHGKPGAGKGLFVFTNASSTRYYVILQEGDQFGVSKNDLSFPMTDFQNNPTLPQSANPVEMVEVNGLLYFVAQDSDRIWHVWRTDGTETGTTILKTIRPDSPYSRPYHLTNVNDRLFFRAYDGQNDLLWVSDGTAEGTHLFDEFAPVGQRPPLFINGHYLFGLESKERLELWLSDGTTAGTKPVTDVQLDADWHTDHAIINDILYFTANEGLHGWELWRSDGTAAGTYMVADIFVGETSSHVGGFMRMNDVVYFSAQDGSAKRRDAFSYMLEPGQLWVSKGTAADTRRVNHVASSLSTYNVLSGLGSFTPGETVLYFRANGGLLQTDGTAEGTVVLKSGYPGQIVLWQDNPLFTFSTYQAPQNNELWLYDIAKGESIHLHTFPPLLRKAWASNLLSFAGQVFFIAGDEAGNREWWITNGTAKGTHLFYDINPHGTSFPMFPVVVGDQLYFVADDGTRGRELWVTDGSPEGTRLVSDLAR